MRVITPGHAYFLEPFEPSGEEGELQVLKFIQKRPVETATGTKFDTVENGTTNEEVLRVLIDRLQFLGSKLPSRENSIAITKLEKAMMWLEKRTKDRKARGVEGTPKA